MRRSIAQRLLRTGLIPPPLGASLQPVPGSRYAVAIPELEAAAGRALDALREALHVEISQLAAS